MLGPPYSPYRSKVECRQTFSRKNFSGPLHFFFDAKAQKVERPKREKKRIEEEYHRSGATVSRLAIDRRSIAHHMESIRQDRPAARIHGFTVLGEHRQDRPLAHHEQHSCTNLFLLPLSFP
jgi:hypothetical protein